MSTNHTLSIFISYSRVDSEFVLKLESDLKSKGINIWLDQLNISSGQNWDREVEKALEASARYLIVLSQASVSSDNVMDELSYALEENKTVIPLLYEDCKIPLRIKRKQYIDFRTDYNQAIKKLFDLIEDENAIPGNEELLLQTFTGHNKMISSVAYSFLGIHGVFGYVLTGSFDLTARLWDMKGNLVRQYSNAGGLKTVAFHPAGVPIMTGGWGGTARLWNHMGEIFREFRTGGSEIVGGRFMADGSKIVVVNHEKVCIWHWPSSELVKQFYGKTDSKFTSVAIQPNANRILTGSYGFPKAQLWDFDGNLIQEYVGHSDRITSVSFSPDGRKFVTGSFDNTVRIWDLDGQVLSTINDFDKVINSVDYSPDGTKIVVGSSDGNAYLYNQNGDFIHKYQGHSEAITSVVFASDGANILTGSYDRTARLWKVPQEIVEKSTEDPPFSPFRNIRA